MAYVAVRGGQEAIHASIERLRFLRLQHGRSIEVQDILAGMTALIHQVMSEASLYSPELAALAIKQAEGSPEEAVFILRAYRSTVPRLHYTHEISTDEMRVERRISAAFKEIPGGQVLGASTDYTHRLLDFELLEENAEEIVKWIEEYFGNASEEENKLHTRHKFSRTTFPKVVDYLRNQGFIKPMPQDDSEPKDVTTASISFPTTRSERLQVLTRGQTGAVTAFGYASLRGFGGGALHPTVGELRVGKLPISVPDPTVVHSTDFDPEDAYFVGEIQMSEVETLIPVSIPRGEGRYEIEFELGYGICFGQNETKCIAMSLLDHNLETKDIRYPTHDEEFVLLHIDSVEATGFISHLKLPHYVTFQSKLDSVRKVKQESEQ